MEREHGNCQHIDPAYGANYTVVVPLALGDGLAIVKAGFWV